MRCLGMDKTGLDKCSGQLPARAAGCVHGGRELGLVQLSATNQGCQQRVCPWWKSSCAHLPHCPCQNTIAQFIGLHKVPHEIDLFDANREKILSEGCKGAFA